MSEVEDLLRAYEQIVGLPWDHNLAGPEKIWFVLYDPSQERRIRARLGAFEAATREAGHDWVLVDLTDDFANWMAGHEYHEAYFQQPEDMELALSDFATSAAQRVETELTASNVDDNTVVAILGIGSLFGITRSSELFSRVASYVKGRMIAFFPGSHDGSNYRLLDARDGWNYLALPITAASGGD